MRDNLSNIEENGNHSFNSGCLQEILLSSQFKSHFHDDYLLSKNPSEYKRNMYQSERNFKKGEDFEGILDAGSEYEIRGGERQTNFNEFTIQPDLETHSVYYLGGQKEKGQVFKHGPHSVDFGPGDILDPELKIDERIELAQNYPQFGTFTNTISEKKNEKKNSHHFKGLSGDFSEVRQFSNSNEKNFWHEPYNKKTVNFLELFAGEMNKNQDNQLPTFNQKMDFNDIFKESEQNNNFMTDKNDHSSGNLSDQLYNKKEQQKKTLPPLFSAEFMKKKPFLDSPKVNTPIRFSTGGSSFKS